MIIIKTTKSDYLFKYAGNIEIHNDDGIFLVVSSDKLIQEENELSLVSVSTYDKFWIEDIEYIKGE